MNRNKSNPGQQRKSGKPPQQPQQQQKNNSQQNEKRKKSPIRQVQPQNATNMNNSNNYQHQQFYNQDESFHNLIHEYLLKQGLIKTLQQFQQESLESGMEELTNIGQTYETELFNAFNKGIRDEFFDLWQKYIPVSIRLRDEKANKLEFYIQIYFLIYNIHPLFRRQSAIDKQSIKYFKEYLDTRGSELAKTNEFLHFYALPYIQKPQEHQALKHLFSNEWVQDLSQKLQDFLVNLYPNEQAPLLLHIYQLYMKNNLQQAMMSHPSDISPISNITENSNSRDTSQYVGYISQLENNNKELLNFADQAKQSMMESQTKWFQVSQDLLMITKDLIKIVENSQNGLPLQTKIFDTIVQKVGKYESFLSTNIEDLIQQSQDISLFDRPSYTQDGEMQMENQIKPLNDQNERQQIKQKQFFGQVDYDKIIKVFLSNSNPTLTCAILQALKWRITKTKGAYIRREIVIQYATYDIIGCKQDKEKVQEALFLKQDRVKEFSLRLINAMASDFYGRSYLVESNTLVKTLINILRSEKTDSNIRRNTLGALQKLSLRRKPQIVMIQNDLIIWIVQILKDEKEQLSEYSYEYATALFMNLSLRSLGKSKCEEQKEEVLKVLNDLLEHDNMQVRTFVNGTLYSLLSRQSLREQAKAMGMNEILQFLMNNSDERFTKQIQQQQQNSFLFIYYKCRYIMDQLNKEKQEDEETQSEANEEDNDVDDIDDEEDIGEGDEAEDVIENSEGMLFGEELLNRDFVLQGQEAINQQNLTKSILDESNAKRIQQSQIQYSKTDKNEVPFNRPTTPSLSQSQISQNQTPKGSQTMKKAQQQQINQNYQQQQQPQQQQGIQNGTNRDLPSEMKSRDKIIRTPVAGERGTAQLNQSIDNSSQLDPKEQSKKKQQLELMKNDEYRQAFLAKPKLPRTPPDDQ